VACVHYGNQVLRDILGVRNTDLANVVFHALLVANTAGAAASVAIGAVSDWLGRRKVSTAWAPPC
jgi:hypothetical protein